MKKKLSILIAVVLVLSMSLVAAPAVAGTTADYNAAVIMAADNLAANQNTDGGFDWGQPDGDPSMTSYTNTLGITAMGILEGYKLEDKAAYKIALGKAYNYVVSFPPTYTFLNNKWTETTVGVDSFPDITFLIGLSNAASSDSSLLTAIQGQVPGATPADIAALAKSRWDDRVNYRGDTSTNGSATGTATALAEWIKALRSPDWNALIPWDLEAAVKAALALDAYFPGAGYAQQAKDIAVVIRDSVDDNGGTYFSSIDTTQNNYVLGLTGAIEAFVEVGEYPGKTTELKALLLDVQQDDGYWNFYGDSPADKAVQDTAYAVMALLRQGDNDAIAAAQKGADWLVSSQKGTGGWYAEGGAGDENLEVTSEAAWAIKVMLDEFGATVGLTIDVPDIVAISVTPTNIDFGTLLPGETSDPFNITVQNIGTHEVDVDADVSGTALFTSNLELRNFTDSTAFGKGPSWLYIATDIAMAASEELRTRLPVPVGYAPTGTEIATLIFTATAS